jgi:hypothetical protein
MPTSPVSNPQTFKSLLLALSLAFAVALAAITKVFAMGWFTLLFLVPYALVLVVHAVIHIREIRRPGPVHGKPLTLILTSHALLLGAFLVQWDAGDGLGWITATALLGEGPGYPGSIPPRWWPQDEGTFNVVAFLPVVASWIWMWAHGRRQGAKQERVQAPKDSTL